MDLIAVSRRLAKRIDELSFRAPVTHVYNPLTYARAPHEQYLRRYGERTGRVLLMGMNPGPFGMAQTGVPFGDVAMVRDFLGIEAKVAKPAHEHPARPITGFACERSEVSGTRLWGWARDRFGQAEQFFQRFFVVNYCPLVFMEEGGRNRTPDKLPPARAPAAARGLRRGAEAERAVAAAHTRHRRGRIRPGACRRGAGGSEGADRLHPASQPCQPRGKQRLGRPDRAPVARAGHRCRSEPWRARLSRPNGTDVVSAA